MLKSIETTGKTENDAIAAALKQLNLDRDSVSVQVIDRAKTGFLGIGSKPAKVKVTYEAPDEPAPAPVEEAPAPVAEEPAPAAPVEAAPTAEPKPQPEKKPEKKADAPRPAKKSRPKKKKPAPEKAAPVAEEPKAAAPVEEGPVEDRTERIVEFLTGLMERLDSDAKPVVTVTEDNIYQVELVGENLGALIGRRGETLDAIQQLTNYAVNNNQSRRVRIHIDAENYRAKREESLQRLARKTAGKAIKYRRNMMLEPMNAYERHVIHAALQDYDPNIST
ncbi:MAG: Jag N-terminal domain-containing protein [Clostridiales bacterium]|nr:Jag N-terminal domain-containing protein [Clostridiales bacterium]